MEEALKDERFSHILTDRRFRKMPKNIQKVTVDKRFKGMFEDKSFKGKCRFDKRGRPLDLMSSENLKNLYEVSSESSENDDVKKKTKNKLSSRKTALAKISSLDKSINQRESSSEDGDLDEKLPEVTGNDESTVKDNFEVKKLKTKFSKAKKVSSKQSSIKQKELSSNDEQHLDEEASSEIKENDKSNFKKDIKQLKPLSSQENKFIKLKTNKKHKETLIKQKMSSSENESGEELSEIKNNKNKFKKDIKGKWQKRASFKKHKESLIKQKVSSSEESESDEEFSEASETHTSPFKEKQLNEALSKKKHLTLKNSHSKKVNDSVEIEDSEDKDSLSDDTVDKDSSEESDDSDDSESDDSSEGKDFDHHWEELRNEAPDTDEITHRLAVCNMDWDRIRANDLFTCFDSFKPTDGCINSLKIYPSEYGLKRMEEEKISGPPELVEKTLPLNQEEEPQDKKGSRYHMEKLRQYQISRLKYYYAVVDCDSPETANALYEQLNGMEYESSSVTFDLRFIPDDVTFDNEPTSVAEKAPNPAEYKPRLFVTSALQQVKVNLTWDETDPKRRETLQKAFTEPDNIENDIKTYLASSSGESEEDEHHSEEGSNMKLSTKDRISKYKELLLSLEEKDKEEEDKFDMEITWEPALKEKTEKIVKNKMKNDHLNPFDEMVQKKQEERKLKRKEQKAMQKKANDKPTDSDDDDDDDDDDDEFLTKNTSIANEKEQNAKRLAELALISDRKETNFEDNAGKKSKKSKLKHKNQKQQKDNFTMDVNDPRFSAIYSSHLYNIDPVDPHYKDAESNTILVQEKQKKLQSAEVYGRNKNPKKARYV